MVPLPSSDRANRLRLLTGPLLEAIADASSVQLLASTLEVLRVLEVESARPPSIANIVALILTNTGAVAGLGIMTFLS